jgi:hypothetical protein
VGQRCQQPDEPLRRWRPHLAQVLPRIRCPARRRPRLRQCPGDEIGGRREFRQPHVVVVTSRELCLRHAARRSPHRPDSQAFCLVARGSKLYDAYSHTSEVWIQWPPQAKRRTLIRLSNYCFVRRALAHIRLTAGQIHQHSSPSVWKKLYILTVQSEASQSLNCSSRCATICALVITVTAPKKSIWQD